MESAQKVTNPAAYCSAVSSVVGDLCFFFVYFNVLIMWSLVVCLFLADNLTNCTININLTADSKQEAVWFVIFRVSQHISVVACTICSTFVFLRVLQNLHACIFSN